MDQSVDETVLRLNNAINTMVEDRLAQYCATLTSEKVTNELKRLSVENIELKEKLRIACKALELVMNDGQIHGEYHLLFGKGGMMLCAREALAKIKWGE